MKTCVLLVDDHRLVRRGFRLLLEQDAELEVVGEAGDGDAALALIRSTKPEVVIMDIHLPGTGGIEVSRLALQEFPTLKIVVLSADADTQLVNEALRAGVSGYVLKESAPEELPRAIAAVRADRLYFSPEVASMALLDYRRSLTEEGNKRPQLSPQEREVLRLLATGLRTKEIATEMTISVKTAETYRRRLSQKLGCQSVAELTRYAIREGLVKP